MVSANLAAVIRPAISSPIAFWLALSRSAYQSANLNEMRSPVAVFISWLAEARAVELVTLSPEPLTDARELVSSANLPAPCLLSMARRNSMPPAGLAALVGTTQFSPEPAYTASAALSAELTDQKLEIFIWKPDGMVLRISFSSQVPTGSSAALPSSQACCDSV